MTGQESALQPFVLRPFGAPQHGDARPGQRLIEPRGTVEQQGNPPIGLDRSRMLGQIAQQKDGRQVVIDRHQNQRCVGPAGRFGGQECGQGRPIEAAQEGTHGARHVVLGHFRFKNAAIIR